MLFKLLIVFSLQTLENIGLVDKRNDKIHFLTYQRTVELYILCFLNKSMIKRKILEEYLLKGERGKRIAFKDVYLPVLQNLGIPITENQLIDKGKGRYNPVIWQLDISALIDNFLSKYTNYLEKKALRLTVSLNEIKFQLLNVINAYQELWSSELPFLLERQTSFPWQISILFMQVSILGLNIKELVQFLPIYLSLSTKFSIINEESSSIEKNFDTKWKIAIRSVSTSIDILNYYDMLLVREIGKLFPSNNTEFVNQIFEDIKGKNFKEYSNVLYALFKQQLDKDENVAYIFNPSPERDEGYWYLLLGIKESLINQNSQEKNHLQAKYLLELQKNTKNEYEKRMYLLYQIIFHSIFLISDYKFQPTKDKKFFFAELNSDNKVKPLFGFNIEY